jgi:hypothetical protein
MLALPRLSWSLGGMGGKESASGSSSFSWSDLPLDFLAGASIFKSQVGMALAVRGPLAQDFRLELGGVMPHQVSGYAADSSVSVVPPMTVSDSARVRTFGEVHALVLYPLIQRPRADGHPGVTVDAGAGISLAFVANEIDEQLTEGVSYLTPYHDHGAQVGPRLQLGAACALTERWSIRLDVAWVDYANDYPYGTHTYHLGFSGFLINPMLEVRL